MRIVLAAVVIGAGALMLGSCETISEEQCMAGDWVGRGYSDGQSGQPASRLDSYAEACAEYGVQPDVAAYTRGWNQGVAQYCVPEVGYRVGRDGAAYNGVCTGRAETDFMSGYQDGRVVHEAQQAVESARSSVDALAARLTELDEKIHYFETQASDTALSDEAREQARNRVSELRRERRDTQRDWRDARGIMEEAERDARQALQYFRSRYGF